jgi:hypothetical protein
MSTAMRPVALALAFAAIACKGDPPAKPAEPATRTLAMPVAPIRVPQPDAGPAAPAPTPEPTTAADPAPTPPPAQLTPPTDAAVVKQQLVHMDAVIERTQQALEQAHDIPSRQKATALLQQLRKRRTELAAKIGAPPTTSGLGPGLAPTPTPTAPSP